MSKADTLLKRATFFERMALYSDRKVFLQALAQPYNEDDILPEDRIKGNLPYIPRDIQEMLSRIVTIDGAGLPLQNDGILGPETRKALDAFKAKYSIPGQFTDDSVFNVIKSTYNRNLDKYGK